MFSIERHIAISAGWVAGPAFGVAMMAAPEYFHLGPIASGLLFWGGIIVFLATIVVVMIVSLHEEGKRQVVLGPAIMMAIGALVFGCGAAWYFWPSSAKPDGAIANPSPFPKLEDIFAKDFGYLSLDTIIEMKAQLADNSEIPVPPIKLRLFRDFSSNTEFVGIFVPSFGNARLSPFTESIIDNLRESIKQWREKAKDLVVEAGAPGTSLSRSTDLVFSGRVFLYTLNPLDPVQIGHLVESYRRDGMFLEIRGSDYLFYRSSH